MDEKPPTESPHARSAPDTARHRPDARARVPSPPSSIFVCAWLLAAAAATVFLAAGPAQGSLGIFLVCAGLVLTFIPARVRVEWSLWLVVGGLLVCGALAFLPARWFRPPSWRAVLETAPAIHLPSTVTPVPWETGFWLAVLGLSCLTGLFVLAHPVRSRVSLWLAAAAVAVCGAYAVLAIYAHQTGWRFPFTGGASFGFFPNRNHTATFLVMGCIAALGVLKIGLRDGRWLLSSVVGAAMAACVAGLFFYSGSRGGVIFLGLGTLIWVAGLGTAHRDIRLLVTVAALTVAAGALFLVSGGEARDRLLGTGAAKAPDPQADTASSGQRTAIDAPPRSDRDTPFDFRLMIWRDTLDMIKDAPIAGTGLGEFAPVFAQYRRASLSAAAPLHPESDWLMFTAEAGVPALLIALTAVALLLSRLRGAHLHPFWPLRWGWVSAAATAILHGAVDVPAHRVALGWWILLLAGLGFQSGRRQAEKNSVVQRVIFCLGGLGALGLGVQLIRAEWFGGLTLPPFAASAAQTQLVAAFTQGDYTRAMEQAQHAVEISPLAAPLYYQSGIALLHFEESDAEVDAAFKAQRVLNPTWPTVPLVQGDAWVGYDPKKAAALWLEALDRQDRVDHAPQPAAPLAVHLYADLLLRATRRPAIQAELVRAVERGPEYLLAWLGGASAEVVHAQLPGILGRPALLATLGPSQREKFLVFWYLKGDRTDLMRFVDENPAWKESSWLVDLHRFLEARQFEQAVRAAAEHYHVSLALPTPDVPVNDAGSDVSRAARFSTNWIAGNTAAARRILEENTGTDRFSSFTGEDWRLRAALAAYDQDWPHAWDSLKNSLRATPSLESLP